MFGAFRFCTEIQCKSGATAKWMKLSYAINNCSSFHTLICVYECEFVCVWNEKGSLLLRTSLCLFLVISSTTLLHLIWVELSALHLVCIRAVFMILSAAGSVKGNAFICSFIEAIYERIDNGYGWKSAKLYQCK